MSSKGLGRGLSSLFAIYEDKPEQKNTTITKNTEQKLNKQEDLLSNSDALLNKYKAKIEDKEPENTKFLKEKEVLETKIKNISNEMYPESSTQQISINRIQPNPDQPRKSFNPDALKDLAQSIKEHGIIQPIIVTPRNDFYIIIAGERRFRASKLAGLKTLPVIIKNYTEQEMREIALIENIQREDLNPIETAMAIKQLIDNYGFTQDEIAQKLGKSRPVIANTLRLLTLQPEVLTLVEKGKLQPAIARAVISLPREQQILLAKKACDGKMTARDVEKTVSEQLKPEITQTKKSNTLSLELISMRDDMQQIFGTKVTVLGNNKKGRIYLDYYNKDDLERIYDLINKLK